MPKVCCLHKKIIAALLGGLIIGGAFSWTGIPEILSQENSDENAAVEALRSKLAEKEKEIKALEEEASKYRQALEETGQKSKTLKNQITAIEGQIKQINYNLQITQKRLEAAELKAEELRFSIADIKNRVRRSRQQIASTLRIVYETDYESLLEVFFRSARMSEFFDYTAYLYGLQAGLLEQLEILRRDKQALEINLDETQIVEQEQGQLVTALAGQKNLTIVKRKEKQDLLSETKNQEKNFERLLAETRKKQEEIEKEIFEIESELRRLALKVAIPPRQAGMLFFPIINGYVTQEYGPTSRTGFQNHFYSFHNGVDIGAKTGLGTPILAAYDGAVSEIGDNGRYAYGKWLTVDHKNGLTTLYAHLSSTAVRRGDIVKKGDIIGYMGRTGFSTGPHLHFTVYATATFRTEKRWFGLLPLGGSVNPRDYL